MPVSSSVDYNSRLQILLTKKLDSYVDMCFVAFEKEIFHAMQKSVLSDKNMTISFNWFNFSDNSAGKTTWLLYAELNFENWILLF